MPHDSYQQFVILFFLGFGLVSAAVANLALRRARLRHRILISISACAASMIACRAYEHNSSLLAPLGVSLAIVLFASGILASPLPGRLAALARRPLAVWRVVCLLGVAVVTISAVRFEETDQAEVSQDMAEVEELVGPLENLELRTNRARARTASVAATTDIGTAVNLLEIVECRSAEEQSKIEDEYFRRDRSRDFVVRRGPADDRTNCFGWIFTDGRFWIPGPEVERIVRENGYREVTSPRPGDLIAYRTSGTIAHLAIVRYVTPGQPVLVEGKWGYGGVYLHAVDQTPYGREFAYLRSPRAGHLLKGLREDEPQVEERTE